MSKSGFHEQEARNMRRGVLFTRMASNDHEWGMIFFITTPSTGLDGRRVTLGGRVGNAPYGDGTEKKNETSPALDVFTTE